MFTKIEIENIVRLYTEENLSSYKICDIYKVSRPTITKVLKNNFAIRIRTNKYKIDHSFFNKIDTEEKAYFLGFLYADGCVSPKNGIVIVSLQESDKDLLEKLCNIIETDSPLKYRIETKSKNNAWIMNLYSKQICDDLIKLGCVPAKSKILAFPNSDQVPNDLMNHFIRGYFDGDGTIALDKRSNSKYISICGTYSMMEGIQDTLYKHAVLDKNKITIREDGLSILSYSGNLKTDKFFQYVYKDAIIYLERKYNKIKNSYDGEIIESKCMIKTIIHNNVEYHKFNSITEAAKFLNRSVSSVSKCIKRGGKCNGYRCKLIKIINEKEW